MSKRIRKNRNKEILDRYLLKGCPKKTERKRVGCLDPKQLIKAYMGRVVDTLKFKMVI